MENWERRTMNNSPLNLDASYYNNSYDIQNSFDLEGELYLFQNYFLGANNSLAQMEPSVMSQQSLQTFPREARQHSSQINLTRASRITENFQSRSLANQNFDHRFRSPQISNVQMASSHQVLESSTRNISRQNTQVRTTNQRTQLFLIEQQRSAVLVGTEIQISQSQRQLQSTRRKMFSEVMKCQKNLVKNRKLFRVMVQQIESDCRLNYPDFSQVQIYQSARFYVYLQQRNFFKQSYSTGNSALVLTPLLRKPQLDELIERQTKARINKGYIQNNYGRVINQFLNFYKNHNCLQTYDFDAWLQNFQQCFYPNLQFASYSLDEIHRMMFHLLSTEFLFCDRFIAVLFLAKVKCWSPGNYSAISTDLLQRWIVTPIEVEKVEELSKQAARPLAALE